MKALIGLFLLVVVAGFACTPQPTPTPTETTPAVQEPDAQEPEVQETEVAQPSLTAAPDIAVPKVGGGEFSLSESNANGRPVVVYFMASWCTTCAKNWEGLNEIVPKYEGQVDFIAVSIDPTDSEDVLSRLAEDRGFAFDTSPGNAQLAVEYDVLKQTAKFAIDADGNIVERHDGALSAEEWDAFFSQLV